MCLLEDAQDAGSIPATSTNLTLDISLNYCYHNR